MKIIFFFLVAMVLLLLLSISFSHKKEPEDDSLTEGDFVLSDEEAFDTELYLAQLLESEQVWFDEIDIIAEILTSKNGTVPNRAVIGFEHFLSNVANMLSWAEYSEVFEENRFFILKDDYEGGEYQGINYTALADELKGKVSPAYAAYLDAMIRESEEDVLGDGTILITWEQFVDLMLNWDKFERTFPEFVVSLTSAGGTWRQSHANGRASSYLELYLLGSDNTSPYDLETNRLDVKLQASYEAFLADKAHKSFRYYQAVQSAFNLWKESNWTYDDQMYELLLAIVEAK